MNSSSGLKSRNYIRDKNSRKLRSDQNSRRDIIIIDRDQHFYCSRSGDKFLKS